MPKKYKGKPCGVCNSSQMVFAEHNKVCLSCYYKHDQKIPKYIPFEQHDLWIINYTRNRKE